MNFKEWITLSESKGIRLPDEVTSQIAASIDKLYQTALDVKREPGKEIFDVATINYKDLYFKDRNRSVPIHIVNNSYEDNHGSFRIAYGIQINVAHVEEKELTPKWVERVLAHELIHSADPKMSDFDVYKGQKAYNNAGGVDYYTHAFEFDAYIGQLVYSILSAVKKYKGTDKEILLRKNLDDTLRFLSNPEKAKSEKVYGAIGDPEYWKYYHIYMKHGTHDQKRRMQQRIYKAVIDAKQNLEINSI